MKEMQSITRRERGLAVSSNEANGAVSTQKEARWVQNQEFQQNLLAI